MAQCEAGNSEMVRKSAYGLAALLSGGGWVPLLGFSCGVKAAAYEDWALPRVRGLEPEAGVGMAIMLGLRACRRLRVVFGLV